MGIPVVCGVVNLDYMIKSVTVVIIIFISYVVQNIIVSGADSLIVNLDIFCLCASLVSFEDAVRIIFTGDEGAFLIVLNYNAEFYFYFKFYQSKLLTFINCLFQESRALIRDLKL